MVSARQWTVDSASTLIYWADRRRVRSRKHISVRRVLFITISLCLDWRDTWIPLSTLAYLLMPVTLTVNICLWLTGHCHCVVSLNHMVKHSALEALRNALYKFKTYLLTYVAAMSKLKLLRVTHHSFASNVQLWRLSRWATCTRWWKPRDPMFICLRSIPACDRQTDGRTDAAPVAKSLSSTAVRYDRIREDHFTYNKS